MVSVSEDPCSHKRKPRSRPLFELGEILRLYGEDYRKVHGSRLTVAQQRTLRELAACRTGALGGHVNQCNLGCGHKSQAYNSCDHRLCPTCLALRGAPAVPRGVFVSCEPYAKRLVNSPLFS